MGVACLEIRGENFHGWLKNREIRESFLPRKFPAIRMLLKIWEILILISILLAASQSTTKEPALSCKFYSKIIE